MNWPVEIFNLPEGLRWYKLGDQFLWEIWGCSGGITNAVAGYIIDVFPSPSGVDLGRQGLHEEDYGRWYVVEFTQLDSVEVIRGRIEAGISALQQRSRRMTR